MSVKAVAARESLQVVAVLLVAALKNLVVSANLLAVASVTMARKKKGTLRLVSLLDVQIEKTVKKADGILILLTSLKTANKA